MDVTEDTAMRLKAMRNEVELRFTGQMAENLVNVLDAGFAALTTAQSGAAELRKEVERLRGAVRAADDAVNDSREGWENAVEMGLLPAQHHATAKKLQEQCWKAARDIRAALTSGPTT